MELLNEVIGAINEVLWSYILIIMLLGCAIWFTLRGKFVQFRMIGEMVRLLGDSTQKAAGGEKHISSFQAFAVSLASRVGTGQLGWRCHSGSGRRTGGGLLDVAHRPAWFLECFRGIDFGAII